MSLINPWKRWTLRFSYKGVDKFEEDLKIISHKVCHFHIHPNTQEQRGGKSKHFEEDLSSAITHLETKNSQS